MDIAEHFDLPSTGHNKPPDALDTLKARVDDLVATASRWVTEYPVITDESIAEQCNGFLDQVLKEHKAIDDVRKAAKRPHLDANKAIDAEYNPLLIPLAKAKELLNPLCTTWLQKKEDERKAAAERARLEAEAKSRAADEALHTAEAASHEHGGNAVEAAVAADAAIEESKAAAKEAERIANSRARIESPHGQRATSLRTHWHARLTDIDAALCHYADSGYREIEEVLTKLANKDARAGARDIPGFEVYSETKAA